MPKYVFKFFYISFSRYELLEMKLLLIKNILFILV